MSLKDLKLEFSDKQAVTGTSADSTNMLNLGLETNNLSGNVHGGGYLNVQCCKTVAPIAAAASGKVTFSANPSANDTLSINSVQVKFVSGTPDEGEIKIGTDLAATIASLLDVDFGDEVALTKTDDGEITVTATSKGTSGNSIALAKSSTAITLSGATLSGGVASNTVTVKLQDSDNGTDFSDVAGSTITLADPEAGAQGCLRLPVLRKYVKVVYGATASLTDGKWDAYIGAPIAKH